MKSPFTDKEMILKKENRNFTFRKESFCIVYHYYLCEDTKEEFTSKELDTLNLNQVYNQYRLKHNILFPEEIIKLRERYNLSASKMSKILGFGDNMYRNYEDGEVPSISNARLIAVANNIEEFNRLADMAIELTERDRANIKQGLERYKNEQTIREAEKYIFGNQRISDLSGYRLPHLVRCCEMIAFFAEKMENVFKTKMNKLLFYADFLHFKRTGYSISGIQYRAVTYGPVPCMYETLYEYAAVNDYTDVTFDEDNRCLISPHGKREFKSSLFTEDELKTMNEIAGLFEKKTACTVSDFSHKEKAWLENHLESKFISYKYSFDLNV